MVVPTSYGLTGLADAALEAERTRLLKNDAFAHAVRRGLRRLMRVLTQYQNDRAMSGIYQRELIQTVLDKAAFAGKKALGITHAEYLGDILPRPTLALILTAVCCPFFSLHTSLTCSLDSVLYRYVQEPEQGLVQRRPLGHRV
jgi:hypothetical protein